MTNAELIKLYNSINDSSELVLKQIQSRNIDWQHLVEYGMFIEAIRSYRTKYSCGLKEAHDAVAAFRTELKVQCLLNMNSVDREAFLKSSK